MTYDICMNSQLVSNDYDITTYKPMNHVNACICMIDIVNFSKWCNNKQPEHIFQTMTSYNTFLNDLISRYSDVDKIELVGDSVLIMAGFRDEYGVCERVSNTVKLAMAILSRLDYIRSIFDENTSLRIGIHVGDIYSGFIESPRKFQLFGNSINVSSRLEQSSLPGTFTISKLAYDLYLENPKSISHHFECGNIITSYFKGVGKLDCVVGYVRQNKILIADDDHWALSILNRISKIRYNLDSVMTYTIEDAILNMKRCVYEICIIDVHFVNATAFGGLRDFREWEKIHRRYKQKVIIASQTINEDIVQVYSDLADGFINKTDIFNLKQYLEI